ncbi:hypothetical protein [Patulibacter americanus]|nr:hypothetical protein [Patulibacter americanus]
MLVDVDVGGTPTDPVAVDDGDHGPTARGADGASGRAFAAGRELPP